MPLDPELSVGFIKYGYFKFFVFSIITLIESSELKIKKFGQTNPLFLRNSLNLYFRPRISTDLNGFEGRLRRLHTIEAGSAAGSEQYGSIPSTASFLATS